VERRVGLRIRLRVSGAYLPRMTIERPGDHAVRRPSATRIGPPRRQPADREA